MKKVFLVFIFLTLFIRFGFSQSIPSILGNLDDLNDLYLVRTNDVIKIIVYNTGYYASGGTYKEKMIYNFDDSVKIAGKRFKGEQICSNFEYKLDDSKRIIEKKEAYEQPLIG